MALNCEKCGKTLTNPQNRLCRTHAIKLLEQMEQDEYLVPLEIRTVGGYFRVSPQRFLTLHELEPGEANPSPSFSVES